MAQPSFQEKSEVAVAIICPDSCGKHAILHINTEDAIITESLVQAGKLLDIEVLDHLVIGDQRWQSLRTLGLGYTAPNAR